MRPLLPVPGLALVLLLAGSTAPAQFINHSQRRVVQGVDGPYVKLPDAPTVKPGRLLKLTAQTNGKAVKWVLASDDADLIVSDSGLWAIFSAPTAGKYLVLAWTAQGDMPSEAARCWVTVGDPGPGPGPPDPPADPFSKSVADAYAKEGDAKKLAAVQGYAALYKNAATLLDSRPDIKTYADLYAWLKAAEPALGLPGNIPAVRALVSAELTAAFGKTPTTPINPALVKQELNKVSAALGSLK